MEKKQNPGWLKFWLKNARCTSLPQSLLPAILAVCIATGRDGFSFIYALLAIVGVVAGHLGLNLFDNYFDYKKKGTEFRDKMVKEGMRARISKCTYLTSGAATLQQLLTACLVFSGFALVIGTIIFLKRGEVILYIALITAVLGIFYSGYPLRLSYRGLGELQIGFMFGPLLIMGVYYSACGHLDWATLFISIPVGLLVANILYTHSILDYEPDKKIGKRTLAVLVNNKTWMLVILWIILYLPYISIIYGVVGGYLSKSYYWVFLTFPMACGLFYLMIEYIKDPHKSFEPKF
ncbi:MAG: prenyltransferase [Odoribacter sp.]|nr:prenyltransferase [Odoribacter sp.]